jgi:murein L,D-transpeptidase YafK
MRQRLIYFWCVCSALLLLSMSSPAAAKKPARKKVAQLAAIDDAESQLVEIYKLIGQSRTAQALRKAESLVARHPNFQLAQLAYGDLLAIRTGPVETLGDVPARLRGASAETVSALREEARLRMQAALHPPQPGTVPSQFVQLAPSTRHAIAVDTSRARLYLFANTGSGMKLMADYYASIGKLGVGKIVEGDRRTPLGVYHITSNLNAKSLTSFYGSGGLVINYPNPYDVHRGKTGGGIWLHGTPAEQFARAPKATDGCVVLANPDLQQILNVVEIRSTPVVIASSLQWVTPDSLSPRKRDFAQVLERWRRTKAHGDISQLLAFYAPDFTAGNKSVADWRQVVGRELTRARGRDIQLKEVSHVQWTEGADTMVVSFGEVVKGESRGSVKQQYWIRQGEGWKILSETM